MKKHFLYLVLLGLLCSIGNVWGDETYYLQTPGAAKPALTGDFFTGATLTMDVTSFTYDGKSYTKGIAYPSNTTSYGSNFSYPDRVVRYDCKTTETDIIIVAYNKHASNAKKVYYYILKENALGSANSTGSLTGISCPKASSKVSDVITITNSRPSSIYFTVEDRSNCTIVQIIATEKGDPLPQVGAAGYTINFNKGRFVARAGSTEEIDKDLEINPQANYQAGTNTYLQITTKNTHYVKFAIETPMVLNLTTASTASYNVSTTKGSSDNLVTGITANVAKVIKLKSSDTYYINPQGSNVQITGMSFSAAPKVTYNANGGSGEMGQTYFTVAGNGFSAPGVGQVFDGWKDGEGNDYEVGNDVESDVTLYAQWRTAADKHHVVYNGGGATGTLPTQDDVEEGQKFIVASADGLTAPSSGMVFRYWNDGVDNYEPGDEYTMETADVYLTAVWAQAYAVYFNTKGGSVVESQQVVEGETVAQPGDPTRPLSTFGGWYTDEECTSAYDFSTTITSATTINASNTLYAKWTFSTVTPGVYDAEQYVLDHGVGSDNTTAYVKTLTDANLALSNNDALDTYNDGAGKLAQNYPYLGLKIKTNNATLQGWIPADCYVVLKVGHMTADGTASWKGANTSIASSDTRNAKVYIFEPANEPSLFTFTTNTASTCVLKSIEVRAANAFPTYSSLVHTPDGYASFFSDYDVQIPAGVKANIGSFNESTSELTLTDIDGDIIPHQTAVILKGVGELTVLTALPSQSSQPEGNDLVGINKEKPKSGKGYDGGDVYVLGYNHDAACLALYTGSNLGANKAWLPVVAASAPSIRIIEANENATALDNMESTEKVVKIIENGQLFILKDGVRYNAIGQIVQ